MILNREPSPGKAPIIEYLVETTVFCEKFGVLPRAGGLLDQNAGWVSGMQMVSQAFAEKTEHERKRAETRGTKRS